ncbi:threonine synthase [Halobacteriales archaeon QS_8_69_26]|nr:MAG: threonine synthase [Halobacteriales archaeon QS_8_69_26]
MAGSSPPGQYCPDCGTEYDPGPDEPWRCTCGHPLELAERPIPDGDPPPFSRLDTRRGLWTFFEFLPVERKVSLGEGFTPLVDAPGWDAEFKLDYVMPTGSFKDRGATTSLSRAVELGVETIVEDSSGNAGAAIATYAARAGIDAEIYVPSDVSSSKLMAIQRSGARPVRVDGDRAAATRACMEAADRDDRWYASHAWNPAFLAGTQTFAFEVAAQRGWEAPDALVIPTGHGTLLLGAYRGFSALRDAGIVDSVPKLLAAQANGYDPVVEAFEEGGTPPVTDEGDEEGLDISFQTGSDMHAPEETNDVADGIHIRDPARMNDIVEALWATGGDAVAVEEDPVELHLDELHRAGFYVEPTCAVGPAALETFRNEGVLDRDEDVVVPLTGSGLKTL